MKYFEVEALNSFIQTLSFDETGAERKLTISIKNYLLKLSDSVETEMKVIDKLKKEIYVEHGDELENGSIKIRDENLNTAREELVSLMNLDSDVEVKRYSANEILSVCEQESIPLSFSDIKFLRDTILKDD